MYNEEDSYTDANAKQIIRNTLKGPKIFSDLYQDNNSESNMEMERILRDLKSLGASKDSSQAGSKEYTDVYKEKEEPKKENESALNDVIASETTDYNVQCGNSEMMKENQLSFDLTNEQLTQAIIYSEILGKPKCKTRRRG